MGIFLAIVISIACILLVLLVLMQNPKGGGLSTDFGSPHQMGGVKQTNEFVDKATWGLAGIIAVLSIVMTLMYHQPTVVPQQQQQQQQTEQTQNTGEQAPNTTGGSPNAPQ